MINDVQSLVRFLLDDFCRADFRSLLLSFWVRKRFNPVAYRSDVSVAESYCRLRFKREFGVLWKFLEDFRNQLLNFRSAVRFFALARPNDVSVRSVESRIAFASRAFTARSKAFECAIASSSGAAKAGTAAKANYREQRPNIHGTDLSIGGGHSNPRRKTLERLLGHPRTQRKITAAQGVSFRSTGCQFISNWVFYNMPGQYITNIPAGTGNSSLNWTDHAI